VKKESESPNKSNNNKSRRKRQDSENIPDQYLKVDEPESSKLPCKISPVKRMKQLEQEETNENIEDAYKNSP
jgi:hypothetical protein